MLYGAKVACYSEINKKQINTLWAECQFLIFKPVGAQPVEFKRLITCFRFTAYLTYTMHLRRRVLLKPGQFVKEEATLHFFQEFLSSFSRGNFNATFQTLSLCFITSYSSVYWMQHIHIWSVTRNFINHQYINFTHHLS